MEYIEHITLDGDRWDQIATLYYGDASRISPPVPAEIPPLPPMTISPVRSPMPAHWAAPDC